MDRDAHRFRRASPSGKPVADRRGARRPSSARDTHEATAERREVAASGPTSASVEALQASADESGRVARLSRLQALADHAGQAASQSPAENGVARRPLVLQPQFFGRRKRSADPAGAEPVAPVDFAAAVDATKDQPSSKEADKSWDEKLAGAVQAPAEALGTASDQTTAAGRRINLLNPSQNELGNDLLTASSAGGIFPDFYDAVENIKKYKENGDWGWAGLKAAIDTSKSGASAIANITTLTKDDDTSNRSLAISEGLGTLSELADIMKKIHKKLKRKEESKGKNKKSKNKIEKIVANGKKLTDRKDVVALLKAAWTAVEDCRQAFGGASGATAAFTASVGPLAVALSSLNAVEHLLHLIESKDSLKEIVTEIEEHIAAISEANDNLIVSQNAVQERIFNDLKHFRSEKKISKKAHSKNVTSLENKFSSAASVFQKNIKYLGRFGQKKLLSSEKTRSDDMDKWVRSVQDGKFSGQDGWDQYVEAHKDVQMLAAAYRPQGLKESEFSEPDAADFARSLDAYARLQQAVEPFAVLNALVYSGQKTANRLRVKLAADALSLIGDIASLFPPTPVTAMIIATAKTSGGGLSLGMEFFRRLKQLGRDKGLPGFDSEKTTEKKEAKRAEDAGRMLEDYLAKSEDGEAAAANEMFALWLPALGIEAEAWAKLGADKPEEAFAALADGFKTRG